MNERTDGSYVNELLKVDDELTAELQRKPIVSSSISCTSVSTDGFASSTDRQERTTRLRGSKSIDCQSTAQRMRMG